MLTLQENKRVDLEHIFDQHTHGAFSQNMQQQRQQQHLIRHGQNQSSQSQVDQKHNVYIAPRPEPGITIEQLNALMASEPGSFTEPFINTFENNSSDMSQTLDFSTSAGYLDGFGTGNDEYFKNLQFNEDIATQVVSPIIYSQDDLSRLRNQAEPQRPRTPKDQIGAGQSTLETRCAYSLLTMFTGQFPTPDSSPGLDQAHQFRLQQNPALFTDRCDSQLTIKASHAMQRGTSYPDNLSSFKQHPISPTPSPPRTAPLKIRAPLDVSAFPPPTADFLNMSDLHMDLKRTNGESIGFQRSSPMVKDPSQSSMLSSFCTSPETAVVQSFQSSPESAMMQSFESSPDLPNMLLTTSFDAAENSANVTRAKRAHSVSSSEAANEAREDLEGFSETNITAEEVAAFMSGPDESNSWHCLYEGCSKTKFSRKENVKSHIQTHLGDRKFFCKACNERFVRPHDLKRHVRSHKKGEYVCECSKDFPRMDALQRHKTRECCPAHPKSPKKELAKRGRPRKSRPETEERRTKAAKTRERVLQRNTTHYASSVSTASSPSPTLAATMSRQASEHSQYSTPPELDLSNSSPMTTTYPDFFASDLTNNDFSLAPSLAKNANTNDSLFGEFFDFDASMGDVDTFFQSL